MWSAISKHFKQYPAQEKVARLLLKHGFCVKQGKIFCESIELPAVRIAETLKIDRRAVTSTIKTIEKNEELRNVFENLHSTAHLKDVAHKMHWSIVEIIPEDASMPGILAGVSNVIASQGISIRQAISEDPELAEDARLYIICEGHLPSTVVGKIKFVRGVKSVVIS